MQVKAEVSVPDSSGVEETRPTKHARHEDLSVLPFAQSGLGSSPPILQTVFLPVQIVLHGFPALPKLQHRKWRVLLHDYLAPELDQIGVLIDQSSLDVRKDRETERVNVSFTCKISQKEEGGDKPGKQVVAAVVKEEGDKPGKQVVAAVGKEEGDKPGKQVVAAVVNRLTGYDGQPGAGERLSASERAARVLSRQRTEQDWEGVFDKRPQVSETRITISFSLTQGEWEAVLPPDVFTEMCRVRVCRLLERSREIEKANRTSKKKKIRGQYPWEVEILPGTPELLPSFDGDCSVGLSLTARFNPSAGLPIGKVTHEPGDALRVGAESLFIALQKARCWYESPFLSASSSSSSLSEKPVDDFRGLLGKKYFSHSQEKDGQNPVPRSVEYSIDHYGWPIDERERELLERAFDGAAEKDALRKEAMRPKQRQRHDAQSSQAVAQDRVKGEKGDRCPEKRATEGSRKKAVGGSGEGAEGGETTQATLGQSGAGVASSTVSGIPSANSVPERIKKEAAETWDLAMKMAEQEAKKKRTSILPSIFSDINLRSHGIVNYCELFTAGHSGCGGLERQQSRAF
uniref:Uncharacterized protein n=1 Tax=Chromera velia CCMP2878 TaxID=1169474 RepID=A0A0G4H4D3_9ALVE|eukprot:Cvel_24656.t1-p1 / transcript=Cvel_24656.t1 / gene=Cvel_24656 / organism=Chromera_velia_CCMP2878 / gene_product=hypothetical protein / transcript_product=hypothetical protein / location=Cvel_scaffold2695:8275-11018(-) / protein_length=572 / sequence_SO=supercontig / SO=protein_coding / is_pseudo=false